MNQEAWNKARETIGVPKLKWDRTRERFMRVLLDEHETILSNYQAQKYGGGEGVDRGGDAGVSRTLGKVSERTGRKKKD